MICILILSVSTCLQGFAQHRKSSRRPVQLLHRNPGMEDAYLIIGDSIYIMKSNCKNSWITVYTKEKEIPVAEQKIATVPLLKVHGNILYNFSYRSYIDTPFAQNNLQQHLVQTTLQFVVKDKYPVQMTLTNRSSNSPYFKNITDVNFNFNRQYLLENIKNDLKQRAISLVDKNPLQAAEALYAAKQGKVQELQTWINSPQRIREFEEEKDRLSGTIKKVQQPAGSADVLSALAFIKENKRSGSATTVVKEKIETAATDLAKKNLPVVKDSSLQEKYSAKKQELAKLLNEIKADEAKLRKLKAGVQDSVNKIKSQIAAVSTPAGLFAFMKQKGIAKNELTKAQKVLLSVNQVGIGRSWVDYSELTVKNISIAGVNAELNPSPFYLAFAAGKVNYRFRDFIFKNNANNLPDQSLYLVRAGLGRKEKNNFILSFYNGKKAILNYTPSNTPESVQRILGISAEGKFTLDQNNYIIAEVAKSSYNGIAGTAPSSAELLTKAFNLKVHTNEAYSIKLFSQNPQTNTKFTAYYRKTGENFQSFNLLPVNVNQEAWMARVNQMFWKRRILLDAAIRKNDFVSPVAAPSFSNKAIFKSLQASLRIPKYPFVSVGYYPSSQLSLVNNTLTENQYNTLNAIISHNYRFKKAAFNTNAVYTRFYNNSDDTAFIYFNASSWTVNQTLFLDKLTLQTSAALTDQKDLHLFTLEQMLGYQFKNRFSLSGSLKWNRYNKTQDMFGGTAAINISINKIGTLQFNYEKTYLPAYNRTLMPVDIGRVGFYREF